MLSSADRRGGARRLRADGGLSGGGRRRGGGGRRRRRGRAARRVVRRDLDDRAVLAAAVEVEGPARSPDDEEGLAVALVPGGVEEHPVARAADDVGVVVARDGRGALALGRLDRRGLGGRG